MPTDLLDLTALRVYARAALERAEEAKPGPWGFEDATNPDLVTGGRDEYGAYIYITGPWDEDADKTHAFIAAARLYVPNLAASVLTLCAAYDFLKESAFVDRARADELIAERDAVKAELEQAQAEIEQLRQQNTGLRQAGDAAIEYARQHDPDNLYVE